MSSSKFLPFQDINGDGLPDICVEEFVEEQNICPSNCVPNPDATVPKWRGRSNFQPFLNQKKCLYQATIRTGVQALPQDDEGFNELYKANEDKAIDVLLQVYGKEQTDDVKNLLREDGLQYTFYHLDPIPGAFVKLLYSVPFDFLEGLPDAVSQGDEDVETEGPVVRYFADDIGPAMLRVRRGLSLYERYLRVYRYTDNSDVLFADGRQFPLQIYGDMGGGDSELADLMTQLSDFLSTYGYSIPSISSYGRNFLSPFKGEDTITEITFYLSPDYKVEKIEFYTEGCKTLMLTMTAKLQHLNEMSAWKNPTAVAYFSRILEMDQDLQAREPIPWTEFLEKYTYPAVNIADINTDTVASCIAENLADEAKALGQDILDEVFSLGDAIAAKFHENLCKATMAERKDEDIQIGIRNWQTRPRLATEEIVQEEELGGDVGITDLEIKNDYYISDDSEFYQGESLGNLRAMALEQAFQTLEQSSSPFTQLCFNLLSPDTNYDANNSILACAGSAITGDTAIADPTKKFIDDLYFNNLDDLKLCGLGDLYLELIQCLFGQLTLEEALAKMVEKALTAMSINNFEQFFVGLPPEERAALDALARQKLESGDLFSDDTSGQAASDYLNSDVQTGVSEPIEDTTDGGVAYISDSSQTEEQKSEPFSFDNFVGATDKNLTAPAGTVETNTIASSLSSPSSSDALDSELFAAYVQAILEYYADNLLDIVDMLGKFPGGPLITAAITAIDCPRPGLFHPGVMEFINDIDLAFCRNIDDIRFPRLVNPFGWLPKIKDILRLLYEIARCAIQAAIVRIIAKLVIKLCELIGSAICNALGVRGDAIASLPDIISGEDTLRNVIRESICGETADDQTIDDTITELVAALGVGGAAFADRDAAHNMMNDFVSTMNQRQLYNMFLGETETEALDIMDAIIENQYPEFRDALPNTRSIGTFFNGIGNLMPADFRNSMREIVNGIPESDDSPANPSICLDPEKLKEYKELRCTLLEGRATPEQCEEMFDNMRGDLLDDLGTSADVVNALNNFPEYLGSQMPAMVSDPGCDNGLLPYESDEAIQAVTIGLSSNLEQLKLDFSNDMLGDGPFEKRWGMLNMMLSDTMGNPLTVHARKVAFQRRFVDYYEDEDVDNNEFFDIFGASPLLGLSLFDRGIKTQRGAFPTHVARYLQEYMNDIAGSVSVNLNNSLQDDIIKFTEVTNSNEDISSLPDFGYNIDILPIYGSEDDLTLYEIITKARKADPDITLSFDDNAKGLKTFGKSDYYYGFDIEVYLSDLEKNEDGDSVNIFSDNMRVKIFERINTNSDLYKKSDLSSRPSLEVSANSVSVIDDGDDEELSDPKIEKTALFEFIAIDETLEGPNKQGTLMEDFIAKEYPNFVNVFTNSEILSYSPPTMLLMEILRKKNVTQISAESVKGARQSFINTALSTMFAEVADIEAEFNDSSWTFGGGFDDLSVEDLDYGIVNSSGDFVLYSDSDLEEQDMVLGISRDAYNNQSAGTPELTRIFYLNPADYGGSYAKPTLYIKPENRVGWLGLVDAMFPELNPCEPQITDFIDFSDISSFVDEVYPNIPEDERAKSDPDCVVELPYNRLMERSAKAGMMGLVKAAIRIYVSAHFLKAFPTFTKFSPRFPQVYSSAFASYIAEDMETSFREAQPGFWELFNTFKDTEFWYGFLEQCVQTYGYLVDNNSINPPPNVVRAIERLNELQEAYVNEYPYREDLEEARKSGETNRFKTLKNYRQEKNLEKVRESEEDAKIVMKELIIQELNYMADKFSENLKLLNIETEIKDLSYYVLEKFTQNAADQQLTLNSAMNEDGTFKLETSLPTVPYEENEETTEPYYTYGGELVVEEDRDASGFEVGQEYVGYYHVHIDEETGGILYMAGEVHSENAHDLLMPIANIQRVPIGDVASINTIFVPTDTEKPFILEKYVRINDDLYTSDAAINIFNSLSSEERRQPISSKYPGTMRLILGPENQPIGIDGELGVRYGLRFSMAIDGEFYELTSVEIDALDTSIGEFSPLSGDSKLLLCLINNLKDDEIFRLATRYIFSLPKLASIVAIYNDMGMLPSIGEITVDKDEAFVGFLNGATYDSNKKPGLQAFVNEDGFVEVGPMTRIYDPILGYRDVPEDERAPLGAWAYYKDRKRFTPGFLEWDDWDQVLLRNSTSRIKKIFKTYYNSRFFDLEDINDNSKSAAAYAIANLKEKIRPRPGQRILPWFMRRRLKTNPFNANGEICEDEE